MTKKRAPYKKILLSLLKTLCHADNVKDTLEAVSIVLEPTGLETRLLGKSSAEEFQFALDDELEAMGVRSVYDEDW